MDKQSFNNFKFQSIDLSMKHPFEFRHPTTAIIAGPTMSGKTQFLVKCLKEGLFEPNPTRIIWVYGEWQIAYDEIRAYFPHIEFETDMTEELYETITQEQNNLVILDDKMGDAGSSKTLADLFTKGAHHRNMTVVFVVQNMFHQGDAMRTVSLNSHYMVLFKNSRDKAQVRCLSSQMYPGDNKFLVAAYEDATRDRYGYLVLDLHPDTMEEMRVRTGIFPSDLYYVYLQRKSTAYKRTSGVNVSALGHASDGSKIEKEERETYN